MITKRKKIKIMSVISKFCFAPYKLGGDNIKNGIDCFFLTKKYCEDAFNIKWPEKFNDISIYDYESLFLLDRKKADLLLTEYLKNIDGLTELHSKEIRTFDILLFSYRDEYIKYDENLSGLSLGINLGNNSVLTSEIESGVCKKPIKLFKINNLFRADILI